MPFPKHQFQIRYRHFHFTISKTIFNPSIIIVKDGSAGGREKVIKGPQTVEKIRKALEFIRNNHFEVPFIAFYRKEYVLPELSVNDL